MSVPGIAPRRAGLLRRACRDCRLRHYIFPGGFRAAPISSLASPHLGSVLLLRWSRRVRRDPPLAATPLPSHRARRDGAPLAQDRFSGDFCAAPQCIAGIAASSSSMRGNGIRILVPFWWHARAVWVGELPPEQTLPIHSKRAPPPAAPPPRRAGLLLHRVRHGGTPLAQDHLPSDFCAASQCIAGTAASRHRPVWEHPLSVSFLTGIAAPLPSTSSAGPPSVGAHPVRGPY